MPHHSPAPFLLESLDALPDSVSVFDYEFRLLYLNATARQLLASSGLAPEAVLNRVAWDTLPHLRGTEWEAALRKAANERVPVQFERHAPSMQSWTETRIHPSASVMTAFTRDIAERHETERRSADAEALLDAILNNTADSIYVKDRDGRYVAINEVGAASVKRAPHEVIGKTNFDFSPPELATHIRADELEVMATGVATHTEEHTQRDGDQHYYLISRGIWRDASGDVRGTVGVATDITERKLRERDTTLLAEAGRVLTESLDYRATINSVAQLVTPALADWCSVVVPSRDGRFETLAVAHADPEKARWAREITERYPFAPNATAGAANVLRTGRSELYAHITDESLVAVARSEEHLALLRALHLRSAIIAPMSVHGRTVGVITLVGAESGRVFTERDILIVEELGRRGALAIENAGLFAAAAAANRAKSEFLASISHELRTPLNAIIGYAELLGDGITAPVSPAQQEQLLRIRASAGHLLGLIEEVLSFSRMEAGQERATPQEVSVVLVLEEAASIVRPMAVAKKLPLTIAAVAAGLHMHTDILKLRQILVNLLTNAVKFTDTGSVSVHVDQDDDCCTFVVTDTGIGIDPTYLQRVFEPFWQVEQTASRRVGGTGLGLSVTRRLARLLGGDVTVTSALSEGSTFVVRLPRDPPKAP